VRRERESGNAAWFVAGDAAIVGARLLVELGASGEAAELLAEVGPEDPLASSVRVRPGEDRSALDRRPMLQLALVPFAVVALCARMFAAALGLR
jgi:hypothetical protein